MTSDSDSSPAAEIHNTPSTSRWKPLRIWPPLILLAGMIVLRLVPSLVEDGPPNLWMSAAFGPALCGLLILIWWLTLSRATWPERLTGLIGCLLIAGATLACLDKSMYGPAVPVMTIPIGTAAFAIGAILCSRMLSFKRTVAP